MNHYTLIGLERPAGVIGLPRLVQDMTHMLPREAQIKGITMLDIAYRAPDYGKDPVSIFDRDGRILYTWPDDYIPSYYEINSICLRLLG